MGRSSGFTAFERKALEIFSSRLSESDFEFDAGSVLAGHRATTGPGFILTLQHAHPSDVAILRERITRFSQMVLHPTLPHDGILTLLVNQFGIPVELEAVSFDHTDWPHDAEIAGFEFAAVAERS